MKVLNFKKRFSGFTLVELLVVITILAILASVAFYSFSGFFSASKNSRTISDLSNLQKKLEVHFSTTGEYPLPDDYFTTTYDGEELWHQGDFGDTSTIAVSGLNKTPKDFMSQENYAYSVSSFRDRYQIAGTFATQSTSGLFIDKAYASDRKVALYGNYSGLILETDNYILAVPSLFVGSWFVSINPGDNFEVNTRNNLPLVVDSGYNFPINKPSALYIPDLSYDFTSSNVVIENNKTPGNSKNNVRGDVKKFAENIGLAYSYYSSNEFLPEETKKIAEKYKNFTDSATESNKKELISSGISIINKELYTDNASFAYCELDGQNFPSGATIRGYSSNLTTLGNVPPFSDLLCDSGTWTGDSENYKYISYSVDSGTTCDFLGVTYPSGAVLTAYEMPVIHFTSSQECSDISANLICNSGSFGPSVGSYNSLACVKGTPNNCSAGNYTYSGQLTPIPSLNHGDTTTQNGSFSQNNGNYTYSVTLTCNDGNYTNISGTGPSLSSCSAGYYNNGGTCEVSTCAAGSINGYSYSNISSGSNALVSKIVGTTNGFYNYSATASCTNGSISLSGESAGPLQCNSGYYNNGGVCQTTSCSVGTVNGYSHGNISHLGTQGVSKVVAVSNGTQSYSATATCNNSSVSISGESAGAISCNSGYYNNGGTCEVSSCSAGEISGYSYSLMSNGGSQSVGKVVGATNGFYNYSATATCNNSVVSLSGESSGTLQCNVNYYNNGGTCESSSCLAGSVSGYSHGGLSHLGTQGVSKTIAVSNGTQSYSATATCNNSSVSISGESAGAISCNSGYYNNGGTCESSSCLAGSVNGYSHGGLSHLGTQGVSKTIAVSNGTQSYSATATCNNSSVNISGESAGAISCNSGYYNNGGTCESSSCLAGSVNGYNYSLLSTGGSEAVSKVVGATNGFYNYSATASCTNGNISLYGESAGPLQCNTGYALYNGACVDEDFWEITSFSQSEHSFSVSFGGPKAYNWSLSANIEIYNGSTYDLIASVPSNTASNFLNISLLNRINIPWSGNNDVRFTLDGVSKTYANGLTCTPGASGFVDTDCDGDWSDETYCTGNGSGSYNGYNPGYLSNGTIFPTSLNKYTFITGGRIKYTAIIGCNSGNYYISGSETSVAECTVGFTASGLTCVPN